MAYAGWMRWYVILPVFDDIVGYQKTVLHSNHIVRIYSVRCPIETAWCSACAPHCRDMHSITECYVFATSRIWCAIRASSNLPCALSIIIFFTTEWSIASIQKSKLSPECTLHGVYSLGWGCAVSVTSGPVSAEESSYTGKANTISVVAIHKQTWKIKFNVSPTNGNPILPGGSGNGHAGSLCSAYTCHSLETRHIRTRVTHSSSTWHVRTHVDVCTIMLQ